MPDNAFLKSLVSETINVNLLRQTMDRVLVEDQRGGWAQDTWCDYEALDYDDLESMDPDDAALVRARIEARAAATGNMCGTTACFAGWTVVTAGGELVDIEDSGYHMARIVMGGDVIDDIATTAQRLLGLNDVERSVLFNGNSSLTNVKETVDQIAAGEYR